MVLLITNRRCSCIEGAHVVGRQELLGGLATHGGEYNCTIGALAAITAGSSARVSR